MRPLESMNFFIIIKKKKEIVWANPLSLYFGGKRYPPAKSDDRSDDSRGKISKSVKDTLDPMLPVS
jgi:hypothetical protein